MNSSDLLVIGAAALIPILSFLILREGHILHAIIGRGMLGMAAAIAYALMGAPDVAVTEALIGAFLVTLLYVVVFSTAGEFRVGYVETPVLVYKGEEKPEGSLVELLLNFGKTAGIQPNFIPFESRETLLEAVREGYMDLGIGPFILPFDDSSDYSSLPVVRTTGGKGGTEERTVAAEKDFGPEFTESREEIQDAYYAVLLSEDAHDIQELLSNYMKEQGKSGTGKLPRPAEKSNGDSK